MSSQAMIVLPYAASSALYPNVLKAPRWVMAIFGLFGLLIYVAVEMVLHPLMPLSILCGALMLAVSSLGLACLSLLYLPLATSLRIDSTGMTYRVCFRRQRIAWGQVRELRLVSLDRALVHHLRVEIVMKPTDQPARRSIDAQLFGWSPEALVEELDGWRTGSFDRQPLGRLPT